MKFLLEFLPGSIKTRPFFSNVLRFSENYTLVSYVCRPQKCVILLSSQYHDDRADENAPKRKPEIFLVYNQTKAGVDAIDKNVGYYTVRSKTNR